MREYFREKSNPSRKKEEKHEKKDDAEEVEELDELEGTWGVRSESLDEPEKEEKRLRAKLNDEISTRRELHAYQEIRRVIEFEKAFRQNGRKEESQEENQEKKNPTSSARKYGELRVMDPNKIRSIVKRCAGDTGVESVQNYIGFIKELKDSLRLQEIWHDFFQKKRPFEKRLTEFQKYLWNHYHVNEEIQKFIDLLDGIKRNDELGSLINILGKKSRVSLVDMEKILLAERSTLSRLFKKNVSNEKYKARFPNALRFNQNVHKNIQNLMTKTFSEHKDLGDIYHEVRLFKAENDFRPDSVIIPSDKLSKKLSKKYELGKTDFILIDYTSNLDNDYVLEKIAKYQPKENGLLWIVGTKWIYSESLVNPPTTNLFEISHPDRIMILSIEEFVDNIGLNNQKDKLIYDDFKLVERATNISELCNIEENYKKYKKIEKSTAEFVKDMGIKSDQEMFEKYGNYDSVKIHDIIISLRKSKDYRPHILRILKQKGPQMTLELEESIKKVVKFKPKIMDDMLKSLEKKNLVKRKLSYDENGARENIYWLMGQEEPMSRYELIEEEVVYDFNQGMSEEKIRKKHKIGVKYLNTLKEKNDLGRPSVFRKNTEHCNMIIRQKWNWDFINLILQKKVYNNLKKLGKFEIDGKTYFDEKDPLKQAEIEFNGKKMTQQTILSVVDRTDIRIRSIFCDMAIKLDKGSLNEKSLRKWVQRYTLNAKKRYNSEYQFGNYFDDFNRYVLNELKKPGMIEKYIDISKKDKQLVSFDRVKRVKLDPNSDSAKVVQWFKENPNLTKFEARERARRWIEDGKMKMKKGSVHNVVDQAYTHFLEGDILNLADKVEIFLNKLPEIERKEITAENLKKELDFEDYQLDTLRIYLNKNRNRK